ncbi:ABC transporter ATP-binding protein [Microbacterium esteraromaticum]|uniref:ABC transporter ATP-binding protein n=1 Tax=Microbacterium esteraromaticum TaxID=57043 RepID=UPI001CD2C094|nr:ABC transporter ATP-binding protein [Microbacterium esteraromaticum]MCA1305303.1 ABC transporter ATP-binding protein [Microbacterium esteraromaticum]
MITIRDLAVAYPGRDVLQGIDLTVDAGEFVTLLGPSGCGKSTLLRAVAGFVSTRAGAIEIGGRDVTRFDPEARGVGFVFQSYALFPHLSVEDNVAFGLGVRGIRGRERRERIDQALTATGLTAHARAMPAQLSGGQQQRVAIARVLVTRPSVLLMDEPLSNLDATLRVRLRAEIQRLHRELGITTLYVTHDQEEALSLSDRVAVMRDGAFDQIAPPREVYQRPTTEYVCRFVGEVNELGGALRALIEPHGATAVFVRPENMRLSVVPTPRTVTRGQVRLLTFLGSATQYVIDVDGHEVVAVLPSRQDDDHAVGDEVYVGFDEADLIRIAS